MVTGNWTGRAANVLASGQADGLILNYARGYRERTLDSFGRGLFVNPPGVSGDSIF